LYGNEEFLMLLFCLLVL
jgi:hypothetical protein